MILAKASHDRSFIDLATAITIVNYDRKTFIVQATGVGGGGGAASSTEACTIKLLRT